MRLISKYIDIKISAYLISSITLQMVTFLLMLVTMKVLGPDQYGIWVLLSPLVTYSSLLSLGVPNAMNRSIPIAIGDMDEAKAIEIQKSGLFFILISALVSIFVFIPILQNFNINSNIIWTLLGLIFFENIHQYLVVMYRSRQKFNLLSRIIYFQSFFLFFIVGFLVWTYGLIGYIGGMAVALSLTVLVFFIYDKAIFRFHANLCAVKGLIKEGIPLSLIVMLAAISTIVDRYVVGYYFGVEAAGFYGVSVLFFSAMMILPTLLAQFYYPKIANNYGKKNKDGFLKVYQEHRNISTIVSLAIVLLLLISSQVIISYLLVDYKPARFVISISIISGFIASLIIPRSNLLLVLGLHKERIAIFIITIASNLLVSVYLVHLGYWIEGVAAGTAFSYIVMSILVRRVQKNANIL